MRFRRLPGFPSLFSDFIEGVGPAQEIFPYRPDAGNLLSRATAAQALIRPREAMCGLLDEQARRFGSGQAAFTHIAKLRDSKTVAVVATVRPGLFGGKLCSWMKALTASRLASWLDEHGTPAVPIIWIDTADGPGGANVGLLSPEGPTRVDVDRMPDQSGQVPDGIEDLIGKVAGAMGMIERESDVVQLLKSCYVPGTDAITAWGRTLSKLLEFGGLIFIDRRQPRVHDLALDRPGSDRMIRSDSLRTDMHVQLLAAGYGPASQEHRDSSRPPGEAGDGVTGSASPDSLILASVLLPVAAVVIDEDEIYGFAHDLPMFPELGLPAPLFWPRASATVVGARCRKVLSRYLISLEELYAGPAELTEKLAKEPEVSDTLERIDALKADFETRLNEIAGLVSPDDRFRARVESSARRMLYQVDKLRDRFLGAQQRRRNEIVRQVRFLCGELAPWGRLQEKEIAGIQFVARHSNRLLQVLYENVDVWKFEHQLVFP